MDGFTREQIENSDILRKLYDLPPRDPTPDDYPGEGGAFGPGQMLPDDPPEAEGGGFTDALRAAGNWASPVFGGHNIPAEIMDGPDKVGMSLVESLGAGGAPVAAAGSGVMAAKSLANKGLKYIDDLDFSIMDDLMNPFRDAARRRQSGERVIGPASGKMDDATLPIEGPGGKPLTIAEARAFAEESPENAKWLSDELGEALGSKFQYAEGITHEPPLRVQGSPLFDQFTPPQPGAVPRFEFDDTGRYGDQMFFGGWAEPRGGTDDSIAKLNALMEEVSRETALKATAQRVTTSRPKAAGQTRRKARTAPKTEKKAAATPKTKQPANPPPPVIRDPTKTELDLGMMKSRPGKTKPETKAKTSPQKGKTETKTKPESGAPKRREPSKKSATARLAKESDVRASELANIFRRGAGSLTAPAGMRLILDDEEY